MSRRRTGPGPPPAALMRASCAALLAPGVAIAKGADTVRVVTASGLGVRVYRNGPLRAREDMDAGYRLTARRVAAGP